MKSGNDPVSVVKALEGEFLPPFGLRWASGSTESEAHPTLLLYMESKWIPQVSGVFPPKEK